MKFIFQLSLFVMICTLLISCSPYKGSAWENIPQEIPGRVQCEFYDTGGEGISYHDEDSINNGSGKLNPANGEFFNEFRMKEGVDISYTKVGGIDDNPYNDVMPEMKQLYVGWTSPGEWIKYTVNVKKPGRYLVALMYTCNGDGEIELLAPGDVTTGPMKVRTTHKDEDTVAWRQWHHWNKTDSLGSIDLKQGVQVLTLKTVSNGNMNYDYLEFSSED